jgi:hypothetical protein
MASQGTTTANAAAPPTPSASGVSSSPNNLPPSVHTVMVGNGGFSFEPSELNDVGVGETGTLSTFFLAVPPQLTISVTFQFYPPDHSVARAEFGSACVPYEYTGRGKQGGSFWSGTQYLDDARHVSWPFECCRMCFARAPLIPPTANPVELHGDIHGANLLLLRGAWILQRVREKRVERACGAHSLRLP